MNSIRMDQVVGHQLIEEGETRPVVAMIKDLQLLVDRYGDDTEIEFVLEENWYTYMVYYDIEREKARGE